MSGSAQACGKKTKSNPVDAREREQTCHETPDVSATNPTRQDAVVVARGTTPDAATKRTLQSKDDWSAWRTHLSNDRAPFSGGSSYGRFVLSDAF
jgi:hypothetical protein